MNKINIAIDGYAACGKSTTAKLVAQELNYLFIDSGAMYRAFTFYILENKLDINNLPEIEKALTNTHIELKQLENQQEVFLNNQNVTKQIRFPAVSDKVSEVSAIVAVRKNMVAQQQRMGISKGIVMDGRDIGTVVFPNAELKVFITASLETRALRRKNELLASGQEIDIETIKNNLTHRDLLDTTRSEGPLTQAKDAKLLDTTNLTIQEQVKIVVDWAIETLKTIP